jgi:hypothetical protein
MFDTYPDTTIYLLCPARIVTGGPEAVHQLADKLAALGHDARIVPVPSVPNPALMQYKNYRVAFADQVVDHSHNILITTEVNPGALDHYHSIQKAIWWLSVDFHQKLQHPFDFRSPKAQVVTHLVQSFYARTFLRQQGVDAAFDLTDYLHPEYTRPRGPAVKSNTVLYTPVKGAEAHVRQLMAADSSLQWLALTGMIRKMHAKTLRQGKVYVDFGSHPGKDRQPREAVLNGCCVLVGRSGAARFAQDLPIPDAYKFSLDPLEVERILATIHRCLADHGQRIHDFDGYAAFARDDEARFEREIEALFGVKAPIGRPPSVSAVVLRNTLRFVRQNDLPTACRGLVNELTPLSLSTAAKRLYRPLEARLTKGRP